MKPKTKFVGNINPFQQLTGTPSTTMTPKPVDKRIKANKHNLEDYSTSYAPPPPLFAAPVQNEVVCSDFFTAPALPAYLLDMGVSITYDPLPEGRTMAPGSRKYDPLFKSLAYGQSIRVPTEHVGKIARALRKHFEVNKKTGCVRTVNAYPADGMGRVWLLEA